MAHAAAKTDEPIREGVVAGIGPFIDTLIICTMSALVLLMTGTWNRAPVGSVAVVTDTVIVVQADTDVEPNLARAYYDEVILGATLGIHLSQEQGREADRIDCKVVRIDNDVQDWTAVGTIALEPLPDELTDENRARLTAGLPVHHSTDGAEMTRFAFDLVHRGLGKFIITIGVCLFAFSTMISWSYYGEKGAEYLFGPRAILPYKFAFVIFVFLGMVLPKFSAVYDFSDATSGMMVLANIPAILILSPHVIRASRAYFKRLDSGDMPNTR